MTQRRQFCEKNVEKKSKKKTLEKEKLKRGPGQKKNEKFDHGSGRRTKSPQQGGGGLRMPL